MVGLAAALVLQVTHWKADRVDWAQAQLEAWAELAAHTNRYSEQVAELLLFGEEERGEFAAARVAVETGIQTLARATDGEFAFLASEAERQSHIATDRLRVEHVRALYRDVDGTVQRILALHAAGRLPDAVAMLRNDVEDRFDVELDRLVSQSMESERREVAKTGGEAARIRRLLGLAMAAVMALALIGTLLAGQRLRLLLAPPITALAEGAEALGGGELTRRVEVEGTVREIEVLAARFNAMAGRIEEQQRRLVRHRAELEHEVQRRTGELQVANRRLQTVDQGRVRFLGDLSHELRTPLTVLRGEAELALRDGSSPARQAAALQVVLRQATQMERLVSDLLFLARSDAEADAAPLDRRPVVLQEAVMEAIEDVLLLSGLPEGSVAEEAWPEEPIVVRADPLRLKQALLIVLDNAVKHAPSSRPVQVGLGLSADGGWADATVCNEGPGLAPAELPRAFERFFRGRNARAGATPGSGLGLPIAKWVVERHGGTIALDSAPAGPTRLRICLPAVQARAHA